MNTDNTGNGRGGGIYNAGTATLANVTVAENHGGNGVGIYTGLNSTTNIKHTADNGGPTQTYALTIDSPALDAGNPNGCTDQSAAALTTDQRGSTRPTDGDGMNGARCDIGAFEK